MRLSHLRKQVRGPRKDVIAVIFITLLFLIGCQGQKEQPKPVPAPTPRGRMGARLSYMEGLVTLTRDKTRLPAELNMVLLTGDTVETGKDAQAEVTFEDSSTIQLDPETRLGITELARDSSSGQRTVKTKLLSGELLAKVAKLAKESTFEIESPTAVAAVRGTEFGMAYKEGEPTQVTVLAGKVGVSQPGKPAYEVLVPEHSRILVKLEERPGKFLKLLPQEEEGLKAKWQQWEERKGKALERLKPIPKILGPEMPKLGPEGGKLGSKLGKANVLEKGKAALEKRKPGKAGTKLAAPKATSKSRGALRKAGKPGAGKAGTEQPTKKKAQPEKKKH